MMNAFRVLVAAALAFLPLSEALAGSSTITTKDAAGVTKTFVVTTDGSGNFVGQSVLCDATAAASCLTITGGKALVTPDLPAGASTSALQTTGNTALTTINTTLGSPFQAGGSIGNSSFASTQSGTWTVGLSAAQTLATVTTVGTVTTLTGGGVASGAADSGNPIKTGGKYNLSPITLSDGNRGDLQLDASGFLKVNVATATGLAQGSTTSGQTGSMVMGAVTTAAPSYTTAQTSPVSLQTDGSQRVAVTNTVAITANSAVNTAQFGGTTVVNGGTAGITGIGGSTATNVALTDNPVNTGGQAVSSENTAVTTGRKVQFVSDLVGKQIVLPYANPENFVSGAITSAMTATTSTSLIAAPAAGLRNYVTQCTVSNSHATVGTDLILQDGSGGTTLYTIPAAPAYGGATLTFPTPLRQPTTATALFVANVTTGSNTKISCSGYKGA